MYDEWNARNEIHLSSNIAYTHIVCENAKSLPFSYRWQALRCCARGTHRTKFKTNSAKHAMYFDDYENWFKKKIGDKDKQNEYIVVFLTWTRYMITGHVNTFGWIIEGPFKFNVRRICINAASYLSLFLFRNTVDTGLIWAAWRCIYFCGIYKTSQLLLNSVYSLFVFQPNHMLYSCTWVYVVEKKRFWFRD